MLSWPRREKIIFLDFLGSGTQIEGGQNTLSTMLYLDVWDMLDIDALLVILFCDVITALEYILLDG